MSLLQSVTIYIEFILENPSFIKLFPHEARIAE